MNRLISETIISVIIFLQISIGQNSPKWLAENKKNNFLEISLDSTKLHHNDDVRKTDMSNASKNYYDVKDSINQYHYRKIFIYSGIGLFIEFATIGLGYQINEKLSVSGIGHLGFIGKAYILPEGASGWGLKISYYFPINIINSINLENIIYFQSDADFSPHRILSPIKGTFFELNVGKENIEDAGFSFFWSAGIGISNAKEANLLILPSFKIGITYNF